jgi:HPt (histidine-containing phosphotransfer) domain-containing protein
MKTDLTYLKNLTGGAEELIKEMIAIFIAQTDEYSKEMKSLLESGSYEELGRLAHKAKSSVAIMGMSELSEDLKKLELLAKEHKETEKYEGYVKKFINESQIAVEELKEAVKQI